MADDTETWVNEVASQISSFYELFVRMGYLSPTCMAYPPHTFDQELLTKLKLSTTVIKLLHALQYITHHTLVNWSHSASSQAEWFADGVFTDLRVVCYSHPHTPGIERESNTCKEKDA